MHQAKLRIDKLIPGLFWFVYSLVTEGLTFPSVGTFGFYQPERDHPHIDGKLAGDLFGS